ncbi:MAG: PEP-CTERM sorting domain-containing protein, partial [Planctomycetaceae bacterium]|nr:PEP-CTERM sorting domain-containing protein [Planctomycetaceae bacterium]
SFDDTITGDGTALDGLISDGFATITVSAAAVPEPSSVALLSIGSLGLISSARNRKRKKASL